MANVINVTVGKEMQNVEMSTNTIIKKGYSPFINNNTKTWFEYDDQLKKYIDTGIIAEGKDGEKGKDGYTPQKGIDYFDGKDGIDGRDGVDGKDALINGRNSLTIEAGENVEIEETSTGIKINSTGGGQTDIGLFVDNNMICMEVEE